MPKSLYDYCIEREEFQILAQWDKDKNEGLTPRDVFYGSNKRVWWCCEKGHQWQALVYNRASGSGCPVCTNRQVSVGENDLATTHPELAAQWHAQKNGTLTPEQVTYGSNKKVWWICDKGHEWYAPIFRRGIYLCNCPICAGKQVVVGENDLASSFPEIAAQWHPTKNGVLTPQMVTTHSGKKAWWICELGHEYETQIAKRTSRASGCPYCSGRKVLAGFNDLATKEPQIAAQWNTELNGTFTPKQVTTHSGKKVWWKCAYGHVWKAIIASRTGKSRSGCPVCAGRKKKTCNDEIEF